MQIIESWPPPYTLRRSKRAKHIRVILDPNKGLQLVYPYFVSKKEALKFLDSKKDWVEQHKDALILEPKLHVVHTIPKDIELLALNKHYETLYRYLPENYKSGMQVIGNQLIFHGATDEVKQYAGHIKAWLVQQAHEHLTPRLQDISQQTKLNFNRIAYRDQKTLWGSCTRAANISLNIKLLFLTPEMADYVMVHELCHTQHLDHSKRFWNLVRSFIPNCHELDKQLRSADQYIPAWY